MVKVSPNFEKSTFFHGDAILDPLGGQKRPKICINKVRIRVCKNRKSSQKFKKMLESCQETSKLSVDSFMASWDRVVPEKSDFCQKNSPKNNNSSDKKPHETFDKHPHWDAIFENVRFFAVCAII